MDTLSILEVDLLENLKWDLDDILLLEDFLGEVNLSLKDYIEWRKEH